MDTIKAGGQYINEKQSYCNPFLMLPCNHKIYILYNTHVLCTHMYTCVAIVCVANKKSLRNSLKTETEQRNLLRLHVDKHMIVNDKKESYFGKFYYFFSYTYLFSSQSIFQTEDLESWRNKWIWQRGIVHLCIIALLCDPHEYFNNSICAHHALRRYWYTCKLILFCLLLIIKNGTNLDSIKQVIMCRFLSPSCCLWNHRPFSDVPFPFLRRFTKNFNLHISFVFWIKFTHILIISIFEPTDLVSFSQKFFYSKIYY